MWLPDVMENLLISSQATQLKTRIASDYKKKKIRKNSAGLPTKSTFVYAVKCRNRLNIIQNTATLHILCPMLHFWSQEQKNIFSNDSISLCFITESFVHFDPNKLIWKLSSLPYLALKHQHNIFLTPTLLPSTFYIANLVCMLMLAGFGWVTHPHFI